MRRDFEVVLWLARIGVCEIRHIQERFNVGRTVAYRLVARLIDAQLVERITLFRGEAALLRATKGGIRFSGLGLQQARLHPGEWRHWLVCADVALWIERNWGPDALMTDRELRWTELHSRWPIASATVGERFDHGPLLHRPDLVIRAPLGLVAVEVELTPKAPRRLETIVRAWRRCRYVNQTIYFCPEGVTYRAVQRAIGKVRADERVVLRDLAEIIPGRSESRPLVAA